MKTSIFRYILLPVLFLCPLSNVYSGQVDTLSVYSKKMDKVIKNLVILPDDYQNSGEKNYPVVYLLHGYDADYRSWLNVVKKNLTELSTRYQFIFVCPDAKNSWYWDSPVKKDSQYQTYISSELIAVVDSLYATIPNFSGRAVTGFSMGGHGSLWLTINHPDIFGACGSMSGCVDIRPFSKKWKMSDYLGSYITNRAVWKDHTVITQIDRLKGQNKSIIIDCGKNDFFLRVNEDLHNKMLAEGIEHTYVISPGNHNPAYWRVALDMHLDFFSDFFHGTDSN